MHAGSIPARASTSRATRESAALAQLVEHIIRNDGVTGSSPVSGTTPLSLSARRFKAKGRSAGCACVTRVGGLWDGCFGLDPPYAISIEEEVVMRVDQRWVGSQVALSSVATTP